MRRRKTSAKNSFAFLRHRLCLVLVHGAALAAALGSNRPPTRAGGAASAPALVAALQRCATPKQLLEDVGRHVTRANDPQCALGSLVWTRLCKLLVTRDNEHRYGVGVSQQQIQQRPHIGASSGANLGGSQGLYAILERLLSQMNMEGSSMPNLVDATKSASVVLRILLQSSDNDNADLKPLMLSIYDALLEKWNQVDNASIVRLEPHEMSGLFWALDNLCSLNTIFLSDASRNDLTIPACIRDSYMRLDLPFRMYPNRIAGLELHDLLEQVEFSQDDATIFTPDGRPVVERRRTAWQGDAHVGPFHYSGKAMLRRPWAPAVRRARDALREGLPGLGGVAYDCCLVNHYSGGASAMRYHIDPDQGTLWGYDTAVVSAGAARRVAFRSAGPDGGGGPVHSFWVMPGDVMHMFGDCQERFQHAVKKAESRSERASRASLVFKQSWQGAS